MAKTRLLDAQEVIGRLDVKRRVAPSIAGQRGWSTAATVPAVVFNESSTTRRRLAAQEALFASYSVRGRAGLAWLRHPRHPVPAGMLIVATPRPPS